MFTKILETFFRHIGLILAPALLIPAIVVPVAWFTAPVNYEATASVWIEHSPIPTTGLDDSDRYLTAAQNQSGKLAAMLRTRWMRDAIATRTSVAALVGTVGGEDKLQSMVEKDLTITTSGNNLLLLRFRSPSPQLSQEFLAAVIDTYRDKVRTERTNSAAVAATFYDSQLQDAQAALDKANAELRDYLAQHPEYVTRADPTQQVSLPFADPTLAGLQNNMQYAVKRVDDAKLAEQQAKLTANAAVDAGDSTFQVIDPATSAAKPTRDTKVLLMLPVIAFVLGLALSSTLLVLLIGGDRAVRRETDLSSMNVRILGTLPDLKRHTGKSLRKRLRERYALRRAIGFVAGTVVAEPSR